MAKEKASKKRYFLSIGKQVAGHVKSANIKVSKDTSVYLHGLPKLEPVLVVEEVDKIGIRK